jgi:Zn-dependent peptidase ImmA (M78 family)
MVRANITRKKSGVPVLSKDDIDEIGEMIVGDFCPEALKEPQEIDIDLLVQDYLKMEQDFQYLSHCGVYLGMTVFNDTDKVPVFDPVQGKADYISAKAHTVIIDNSLLEPNQEHRYRFTMGHEAGHEFLHTPCFEVDAKQMSLFEDFGIERCPMIQCRVDTKKMNTQRTIWTDHDRMEWQANALSAAILMPKSMVKVVVERMRTSNYVGYVLHWMTSVAVSEAFNVSFESATYRLKQLGYIPKEEQMCATVFPASIDFAAVVS